MLSSTCATLLVGRTLADSMPIEIQISQVAGWPVGAIGASLSGRVLTLRDGLTDEEREAAIQWAKQRLVSLESQNPSSDLELVEDFGDFSYG